MSISLTSDQILHLQDLKNQNKYSEAYQYLRDIVYSVEGEDSSLAKWLDVLPM